MSEAQTTKRERLTGPVPRPVPALAYRPEDAAALIGLSRPTIFRLIKRGAIRVKREGKSVLITHRDLEAYVDALPYEDRGPTQ
jgi:excisionase family DNA binding protein